MACLHPGLSPRPIHMSNFLYPCQSTQRENSDDPDHRVHHHSSIAAHHADRQGAVSVRRLLIRSWTTLLS
jgi:hypothetical protein